jgi:hypothetical protein
LVSEVGTPSPSTAGANALQPPEVIGGFRAGPAFLTVIYVALVVAAAVALSGERFGFVPAGVRALAPMAFAVFVVLLGVYRFALVRAHKYSAMKAFVQVGIAVGFLLLLVRASPVPDVNASAQANGLSRLFAHRDPEVRAAAAELARYRPASKELLGALVTALADPSAAVREAARGSLVALAGSDVGGEGSDATERWRAWVASQTN